MGNKKYSYYSSLLMGCIFIILGIIILMGMDRLYNDIVKLLVYVFLIISLFNLLRFITKKDDNRSLVSCLFNLGVSLVFVIIPNIPLGIIPFMFSLYLILISISNLIMYILFLINKSNHKFGFLFNFIIYLVIAIPIMIRPIYNSRTFIICLSIYLILLGFNGIIDFIINIIPIKTKNKLKRRIRITLPKLLESFIPYSVMKDINKVLEVKQEYNYFIGNEDNPDIEVIIHTSNNGVNKMGHLDICYEGIVYSYGNYDEGSRILKKALGDGVLFLCNDINKYINFCIDNSKKTMFVFGIKLTEQQKNKVNSRIKELMGNVYSWNYKDDKLYNNGESYASKLYKKTKAKFYKFKGGKYKTYFVLGSNCCYLVDDILGKSGMDILSLNGIVTPGTYYSYFDREINRKNSSVISKNIYNSSRRATSKGD